MAISFSVMPKACTALRISYRTSSPGVSRRPRLLLFVPPRFVFSSGATGLLTTKGISGTAHLSANASRKGKHLSSEKQHDVVDTLTGTSPGRSGPLNVLVVDDSAIVRQVLADLLSEK